MVKLNIYVFLLVISTWAFQGCDNNDDDSISVPTELQNAFSTMYPDVAHVKWEAKGQYYVADFRNNSNDASAWYTTSGQWEMTETDILYSALSANIKASFEASEYSKAPWKIDDVDKLERREVATTYVIEVESKDQEVDLYYSEDGVLIKTAVEVEDEDSSDYLPSTELSAAMKSFIETHYVGARIMEVDIEDDRNEPEFGFIEVDIIHAGIHKEMLFDKSNEWYSTSWEIFATALPIEVKNAISSQFPGYRIDDVDLYEKPNNITYYLIELEGNGLPDKLVKYLPNGEEVTIQFKYL